jgi:excisionase family DNA binding protein
MHQDMKGETAKPSMTGEGRLLTVHEACQHLRISRWMFYRLLQSRQLATIKIGRRRLVPHSAVDHFIQDRLESGGPA